MIRINVTSRRSSLHVMHASGSDPWNDVTHEGSVDAVCNVIIHIYNLEKLRNFRVFGAAIDVNHVSHPPGPVCVLDDHCHSCLDVEKDRICFLGGQTLFALSVDIHLFT